MQRVTELVEQRTDLVRGHQRRGTGRRLHQVQVDTDQRILSRELQSNRVGPLAAVLTLPGIRIEIDLRHVVPSDVGDIEYSNVRMPDGWLAFAGQLGERQLEQCFRQREHAFFEHPVEHEVFPHPLLVDADQRTERDVDGPEPGPGLDLGGADGSGEAWEFDPGRVGRRGGDLAQNVLDLLNRPEDSAGGDELGVVGEPGQLCASSHPFRLCEHIRRIVEFAADRQGGHCLIQPTADVGIFQIREVRIPEPTGGGRLGQHVPRGCTGTFAGGCDLIIVQAVQLFDGIDAEFERVDRSLLIVLVRGTQIRQGRIDLGELTPVLIRGQVGTGTNEIPVLALYVTVFPLGQPEVAAMLMEILEDRGQSRVGQQAILVCLLQFGDPRLGLRGRRIPIHRRLLAEQLLPAPSARPDSTNGHNVFSAVHGPGLATIASMASHCSRIAYSNTGGKCSAFIRSKAGSAPGSRTEANTGFDSAVSGGCVSGLASRRIVEWFGRNGVPHLGLGSGIV